MVEKAGGDLGQVIEESRVSAWRKGYEFQSKDHIISTGLSEHFPEGYLDNVTSRGFTNPLVGGPHELDWEAAARFKELRADRLAAHMASMRDQTRRGFLAVIRETAARLIVGLGLSAFCVLASTRPD